MTNQNTVTSHLTEEQVKKLRDHLKGHHLESILTLALVTGMRRDELLSLKWQDVDLDTHHLSVQNTKTKNSESLPIPEDVAEMLKQHRVSQMEAKEKAGLTRANLDLVFPDCHGEPLDPHQLVKGFHEVLEQAKLPRISFHDLRSAVGQTLYNTRKQKGA